MSLLKTKDAKKKTDRAVLLWPKTAEKTKIDKVLLKQWVAMIKVTLRRKFKRTIVSK